LQHYAHQKEQWVVNIISCNDEFIEECHLRPEKQIQLYHMVGHLQQYMNELVPDEATHTYFTISRPKSVKAQRKTRE